MQWTDERVELLKKLWADGLSASQIAAQLGGVTRNAVIGKVHRLKLSGRGRTTSASRPKKPARPATGGVQSGRSATRSSGSAGSMRPMTVSSGATALKADYDVDALAAYDRRPIEDIVVPISRRLSLIQLSEQTCKWPVGDPLSDDFHFCGTDTSNDGPYCRYHARLAYQPASERRRSR